MQMVSYYGQVKFPYNGIICKYLVSFTQKQTLVHPNLLLDYSLNKASVFKEILFLLLQIDCFSIN